MTLKDIGCAEIKIVLAYRRMLSAGNLRHFPGHWNGEGQLISPAEGKSNVLKRRSGHPADLIDA